MGPDPAKTFLKKNAELIPAGETVSGVIIAEPKGGAWRRGLRQASTLGSAVVDARDSRKESAAPEGAVAEWPESPAFWLVLTDKQLHVFEGRMGSSKAGPGSAHYPFERIASALYDKKLTISKLEISFTDGSALELGVAKQKVKPFVEALEQRFANA
jgi:hypothetical protein